MRSNFRFPLFLSALLLVSGILFSCQNPESPQEKTGTTYQLYFAGGQSNMEGYGYNKDLPETFQETDDHVLIFRGNQARDHETSGGYGKWMPLSPGFGRGYTATDSSVQLSNRFGPELSFGKRIAELSGENIAIIKYARGGSSIALGASGYGAWAKRFYDSTTINQWDHFYKTVQLALSQKDIDGDGVEDKLIPAGIIWMQGEADAVREDASKVYYQNLDTLMNDITEVFGVAQLPTVLCRIEESGKTPEEQVMPHIDAVWDAQIRYAASHDHVELIRMDSPMEFLEDKWHYKSHHYIDMGNKFAEALHALRSH